MEKETWRTEVWVIMNFVAAVASFFLHCPRPSLAKPTVKLAETFTWIEDWNRGDWTRWWLAKASASWRLLLWIWKRYFGGTAERRIVKRLNWIRLQRVINEENWENKEVHPTAPSRCSLTLIVPWLRVLGHCRDDKRWKMRLRFCSAYTSECAFFSVWCLRQNALRINIFID